MSATEVIPLVLVQPSALEVIRDVQKGEVKRESFYVDIENPQGSIDGKVDVYRSGDETVLYPLTSSISSVVLGKSHRLELTCASDLYSTVFPRSTFSRYQTVRTITTVDVSPGEQLLVVGDDNGSLDVLSLNVTEGTSGAVLRKLEGHYVHTTIAKFFPSGQAVLSAGDMTIKVWDLSDGWNARTFTDTGAITSLSIVGSGRNIISGSANGTVKMFDCGSGQCVYEFDISEPVIATEVVEGGGSESTSALEFETSGKSLIVATATRTVVYDLAGKQVLNQYAATGAARITAMTANAYRIVTGHEDGTIQIIQNGIAVARYSKIGSAPVVSLRLQTDLLVAAWSDTTPVAIDLVNDKQVHLSGFDTHALSVTSLDRRIYVAGKQGSLRSYEIHSDP